MAQPKNTQFDSNAAGRAAMEKSVTDAQRPPSQVTGSGIPMKDRGAFVADAIRNRKPITDADLVSKTEYVDSQRKAAGLPTGRAEIMASLPGKTSLGMVKSKK